MTSGKGSRKRLPGEEATKRDDSSSLFLLTQLRIVSQPSHLPMCMHEYGKAREEEGGGEFCHRRCVQTLLPPSSLPLMQRGRGEWRKREKSSEGRRGRRRGRGVTFRNFRRIWVDIKTSPLSQTLFVCFSLFFFHSALFGKVGVLNIFRASLPFSLLQSSGGDKCWI